VTERRAGVSELRLAGVASGAGWTYVGAASSAAISLVVMRYVLRELGADAYGVFTVTVVFATVLSSVDFGLTLGVSRSAARAAATPDKQDREHLRLEVAVSHTLYLALAGAAFACIVIATTVLPSTMPALETAGRDGRITLLLVGLASCVTLGLAAAPAVAFGHRAFRLLAVGTMLGAVSNLVLVLALAPSVGVIALGVGSLVGALVSRTSVVLGVRQHARWFSLHPIRPTRSQLRRVTVSAGPLLALSVGVQIVNSSDTFVLGALTSASAVGLYRLGAVLPGQAVALIFRGYDTIFPVLVGSRDKLEQEAITHFLTRIASYSAGAGFAAVAVLRHEIVGIFLGRSSPLASTVLFIFCIVWTFNVIVHGIALLLIARERQRILAEVVLVEAGVNIAVSIALVMVIGPVGAAYGTLIALTISNVLIVPFRVRREFEAIGQLVWRDGIVAAGVGASVAAASALLVIQTPLPGPTKAFLGLAVAFCVALAVGYRFLGDAGRATLRTGLARS